MKAVKFILCHFIGGQNDWEVLSVGADREALQKEAGQRNRAIFERDLKHADENPGAARPIGIYPHFYVEEVPEWPLAKDPIT